MGNVFGKNIQFSIFGESHGPAIGMALAGLPAGFAIDWDEVVREMARRAPGHSDLATPRREDDRFEVLSGFFDGHTTGAPLSAVIRNTNPKSSDYRPELPRPGHADLVARYKYGGYADPRGGGHFSGRLTAPLVLAGAIARQILAARGVAIGGRIAQISDIADVPMPIENILAVSRKAFPVYGDAAGEQMKQAILAAKAEGDSVGGVIECAALGLPAGLGDPFFDSLESVVAAMAFSIPAIKGIEFGDGFSLASMKGSAVNDPLCMDGGAARLASNHNGGVNGGISNGQPLLFRVAVKPTPTIACEQTTVDLAKRETVTVSFGGRHDPCIVPRALPAVEAGLALCLLDLWPNHKNTEASAR